MKAQNGPERWQKNQKVIHFSAPVFLPVHPGRFRTWSLGLLWMLVLGIWCFFTGCSFAPKYQRPAVQTPAAFKELTSPGQDAANVWKVAKPNDDALRGKWWEVFTNAQLNALEEQVAV